MFPYHPYNADRRLQEERSGFSFRQAAAVVRSASPFRSLRKHPQAAGTASCIKKSPHDVCHAETFFVFPFRRADRRRKPEIHPSKTAAATGRLPDAVTHPKGKSRSTGLAPTRKPIIRRRLLLPKPLANHADLFPPKAQKSANARRIRRQDVRATPAPASAPLAGCREEKAAESEQHFPAARQRIRLGGARQKLVLQRRTAGFVEAGEVRTQPRTPNPFDKRPMVGAVGDNICIPTYQSSTRSRTIGRSIPPACRLRWSPIQRREIPILRPRSLPE